MLGKTHAVVGVTAGLLMMRPKNMTELVVGTAGALIGSVISDIDVGTSGSHRDANKMIAIMVSAVVAVGVADHIWQIGIYSRLIQHTSLVRIWLSVQTFLTICAIGMKSRHRTFMHSFLAMILLTCCLWLFLPVAAGYFAVGFATHLLLDFFNKKGERLFFPVKRYYGIRILSSSGLVNDVLFGVGFLAMVRVIWMFVKKIYL